MNTARVNGKENDVSYLKLLCISLEYQIVQPKYLLLTSNRTMNMAF